jgi:hypothetical protein
MKDEWSEQQPTNMLSYLNFLQQIERLMGLSHQLVRRALTEYCDALDRLSRAPLQADALEREQILVMVNRAQNIPDGVR